MTHVYRWQRVKVLSPLTEQPYQVLFVEDENREEKALVFATGDDKLADKLDQLRKLEAGPDAPSVGVAGMGRVSPVRPDAPGKSLERPDDEFPDRTGQHDKVPTHGVTSPPNEPTEVQPSQWGPGEGQEPAAKRREQSTNPDTAAHKEPGVPEPERKADSDPKAVVRRTRAKGDAKAKAEAKTSKAKTTTQRKTPARKKTS